ncbi:THO complex subunit 7 [Gamsiella multidivaricata]|nr:THO complex subunit 7 [Gamsiella multidivaricata]
MAERERLHYDQDQRQIEENISKSEEELQVLAYKLEEVKQERANKIKYDELATEVSKFPSRESSEQSIANLQAEILELEQQAVRQSETMELRKKQFFTALQCLQNIQESIEEDQREEAKRLFHTRTHHEEDDDEEGGFVEAMEVVVTGTESAQAAIDVNEMEQMSSQEGQCMTSDKRGGSTMASPALSASHTPGGGDEDIPGEGDEGVMLVMNLQHSTSNDSLRPTPVGTPGRAHHPSSTPPSRSLTATPNPADIAMNMDAFLADDKDR